MKSYTIVHIIKGLGQGGAERLLVSTIRQHSSSYRFHVIYFLSFKNQLSEDLTAAGATVHHVEANHPLLMLLNLNKLVRLIRKISPDIIHAHLPLSGFVAALASKICGIPLVYTEHNIPSSYQALTRFIHPFTIKTAVRVVAVSKAVQNELLKGMASDSKSIVIENGTDLNFFSPDLYVKSRIRRDLNLPEQKLIIGTVAVFTYQKRLDRWLEICKKVHEHYPETFFLIAGHGPLEDELKAASAEMIQKKILYFPGRTSHPEQWMAAMDIYLMSSDFEGMPVAMLEAMSLELPVVASNVGGISDAIEHGSNGFLYQASVPDEALKYIELLCDNAALRQKIGRNARSIVLDRFNSKIMVNRLEEIYLATLMPFNSGG